MSAEPGACGAVLFKAFDLDSNAMIDHDEFIQLMNRMLVAGKNERMKQTDTSGMFKEIDTNGDNLVDEDEFMAWATKVLFLSAAFASGPALWLTAAVVGLCSVGASEGVPRTRRR